MKQNRKCIGHLRQRDPVAGLLPCATCHNAESITRRGRYFMRQVLSIRINYMGAAPPLLGFTNTRDGGATFEGSIWFGGGK